MSYIHDIGGLRGLGTVPDLDDDLDFHAAWEARVFGLVRSLRYAGAFTTDELRHTIERMEPTVYLGASYFQRWLDAVERLCREKGLIDEAQLDEIRSAMAEQP